MTQSEQQDSDGNSCDGQSSQAKSRWRFQYGISGLMAVAVGVAAWFATMNLKDARWPDGILAVVVAFLVIGLISQSWDLGRKLHRDRSFSSEHRWGLRFGIAWRLAIVCVFVGHYVILTLLAKNILVFQKDTWPNIFLPCIELRGNLFQVALLIVLGSVCANREKHRKTVLSRAVEIAGSTAGAAWFAFACVDAVIIPFLTCLAIWGMQRGYPPRFSEGPIGIQLYRELESTFFYSLITLILVANGTFCVSRMGRLWERGHHFRRLHATLSVCSLALATVFPVWLFTCALQRLLPLYAMSNHGSAWHNWLVGATATVACVTVVAWRIARRPVSSTLNTTTTKNNLHDQKSTYFHECTPVLTCLVFAVTANKVIEINELLSVWDIFSAVMTPFMDDSEQSMMSLVMVAAMFFMNPKDCLNLAILILASQTIWQRWRARKTPSSRTEYAVSPLCLAGVWLGLIWACAVGVTALFWISWYLCLWPGRFWFW